jgi:hypothetical protein
MCIFMPKRHWLPFFVWCISGSLAQVRVDLAQHRLRQLVLLQQAEELQQGRRIRHLLARQVSAHEFAHRRRQVTRRIQR